MTLSPTLVMILESMACLKSDFAGQQWLITSKRYILFSQPRLQVSKNS